MSVQIPRPKKSKRDAAPEVIVQQAIPLSPVSEETNKDNIPMERLPSVAISPNAIPDGMKSERRRQEEQHLLEAIAQETGSRDAEYANRILKVAALGAGIGLGVLLCTKGYSYVFPAIKEASSTITENIEQ